MIWYALLTLAASADAVIRLELMRISAAGLYSEKTDRAVLKGCDMEKKNYCDADGLCALNGEPCEKCSFNKIAFLGGFTFCWFGESDGNVIECTSEKARAEAGVK